MDSVGSKLMLARRAGRLRWAGMDLAAHCINDVLCTGADPLFLLDYVAANRIDAEQVAELVEGAAEVCRAAGCVLIGGETAELPGIYQESELDFAGTCVGLVERGSRDRRVALRGGRRRWSDFRRTGCTRTASRSCARSSVTATSTPSSCSHRTRLYLDEVRDLRGRTDVRALAHVTGGGILGQPLARAARRSRGTHRLGELGATACLRVARGARRGGGRAQARLQPGHRHVRRRPRSA